MTHLTPADLDRLDALEKAATPGPWAILPQEGPDGWPRLIAPIEPEADDDIEPDHYHVSDLDDCITDANGGLIVALRNAYPQLAAEIRRLWAEVERIETHPWGVLREILDRVFPESVFPTTRKTDEHERDAGPRIVALTRWVDELRAENERLRAVRDVAAKVERCRGGDMPNENIIESRLLDELRTTLDAARGGA